MSRRTLELKIRLLSIATIANPHQASPAKIEEIFKTNRSKINNKPNGILIMSPFRKISRYAAMEVHFKNLITLKYNLCNVNSQREKPALKWIFQGDGKAQVSNSCPAKVHCPNKNVYFQITI
jgi:hypothetical protein